MGLGGGGDEGAGRLTTGGVGTTCSGGAVTVGAGGVADGTGGGVTAGTGGVGTRGTGGVGTGGGVAAGTGGVTAGRGGTAAGGATGGASFFGSVRSRCRRSRESIVARCASIRSSSRASRRRIRRVEMKVTTGSTKGIATSNNAQKIQKSTNPGNLPQEVWWPPGDAGLPPSG